MRERSVVVWDLETVPDLAGFAAAHDLIGKSDAEVREAIGDKFPKHIYHSIICIGALIAHREPDHWAVDAIGAPHVGERTEKQLDQILLRQDRGAEPAARHVQRQQLRFARIALPGHGSRRIRTGALNPVLLSPVQRGCRRSG